MDCYKIFGFLEILRESFKVLSKNGRLMAFIATFFVLLYSLLFLWNFFSVKPLIYDLVFKVFNLSSAPPGSSEFTKLLLGVKEDIGIFLGVELAFILAYYVVSLLALTAAIFVSALPISGHNLSVKELVLRVGKSWTRPFFTMFYIKLFGIGYMTLCGFVIMIPQLMISNHPVPSKSISMVFGILASIFYIHLSVVCLLGLVGSVMEKSCYGVEALGKGGQLVKGKRLHGFILNLVFSLLYVIIFLIYRVFAVKLQLKNQIFAALFMICSICLVTMFQFIAFTVLYFQCKKNNGEDIELQGKIAYSKIPTTPLVHEDIP